MAFSEEPPAQGSSSKGPIYTLGTSNHSPEKFLQLLREYGVEVMVDVRRFPASRFPHFNGEVFAQMELGRGYWIYLTAAGTLVP